MYQLTYWPKRGRGEQIRLLLSELDQPWHDIYVSRQDGTFQALQAEGPSKLWFGSIPMIERDGFRLVQGCAIMGWLARRHGMLPAHAIDDWARADAVALGAEDLRSEYFGLFGPGGAEKQAAFVKGRWRERWLPAIDGLLDLGGDTSHFVGGVVTHADVAMFDALDAVLTWVKGARLEDNPRVDEFMRHIGSRPRIAAYLASERRLDG